MTHHPEFRVTIRVRNNRLLKRREALGMNQRNMADFIGVSATHYAELEQCKRQPVKNGEWIPAALTIAEYYDVDPEELFPDAVLALTTNKVERELEGEALALLGSAQATREMVGVKKLNQVLDTLTTREQTVIRSRYGLDGEVFSLDEVGKQIGVGRARVRQIEVKALRKLRHPARSKHLKPESDSDTVSLQVLKKLRETTEKNEQASKRADKLWWRTRLEDTQKALTALGDLGEKTVSFLDLKKILRVSKSKLIGMSDVEAFLPNELHRTNPSPNLLPCYLSQEVGWELYNHYWNPKPTNLHQLRSGWEPYVLYDLNSTFEWFTDRLKEAEKKAK